MLLQGALHIYWEKSALSNCVRQNPDGGLDAERQEKCNRMTRGLVLELQRISGLTEILLTSPSLNSIV